jgi:hypothetical protein
VGQDTFAAIVLMVAFLIYITARNELRTYLGFLTG